MPDEHGVTRDAWTGLRFPIETLVGHGRLMFNKTQVKHRSEVDMKALKKKQLSALTIRRLRKVKDMILAEPESYNQASFRGTATCIAGFCVLAGRLLPRKEIFAYKYCLDYSYLSIAWKAAAWLSCGKEDTIYYKLFNANLIEPFEQQYDKAKTARGRAGAAARRIEHFIKTDGAE